MLEAVCRDFGATLVEMNGGDDHMHLLVEYPPKIAVSALVNSLKGVSSILAKRRHPELGRRYWKGRFEHRAAEGRPWRSSGATSSSSARRPLSADAARHYIPG